MRDGNGRVDKRQRKRMHEVARPALVADERCIVGERQGWWQTRGGDELVVAASRQVTRCDSRVALMAAAEGTAAADERGTAMTDKMDKR
jgi:hypothetical protein